MKKSSLPILFLIIFLALIVVPGLASAAVGDPNDITTRNQQSQSYAQRVQYWGEGDGGDIKGLGFPEFIATRIALWETNDITQEGLTGITLKYLSLFLIILLVYSALAYVNFPESSGGSAGFTRFLISLVVGLMATFLITSQELLAIVQSYTALGITLSLFFPIMILAFITLVTAKVANPVGIFAQKIMWAIYSIYLFFKTSLYLIVRNDYHILRWGGDGSWIKEVASFFVGGRAIQSINNGAFDPVILTVMLITSIAVFIIFVWQNKAVDAWIAKEERDSEIESARAKVQRSDAYDTIRAQQMQKGK